MIHLSAEQIKRIELDILISLADYCDKHNLNYYLAYGTLLGAKRHQGFIPWDDDIDIIMLRKDYEKLNELLQKEQIREDLVWLTLDNDGYDGPFGKLTNKNTDANYCGNGIGLWVDVFPIDYYDEKVVKHNKFLRNLCLAKGTNKFKFDKKTIIKFILKLFLIKTTRKELSKKIIANSLSVKPSQWLCNSVWNIYTQEKFYKSMFENPSLITFEGHEFKTVSDVDSYLRLLYQDYMKLPPENKRRTHAIDALWISDKECPFK